MLTLQVEKEPGPSPPPNESPIFELQRPIVFVDCETDGPGEADAGTDRIIQFGYMVVERDREIPTHTSILFNPGPGFLPLKRTEIHGITDAMVANAKPFSDEASNIRHIMFEADVATFNGNGYDIPLLWEEFFRAGIEWDLKDHNFIDVSQLWRKMEPRSLSDAVRRFLGTEPAPDMHNAAVDARCTHDVLLQMLVHWTSLPHDTIELAKLTAPVRRIGGKELPYIDLFGALVRNENGDAVYTHRQQRGVLLKDNPGYAGWILSKDFPEHTKRAIRAELQRIGAVTEQSFAFGVRDQTPQTGKLL